MKDYYLERESRLPVKARYDVLVAGSGPAGFAARGHRGARRRQRR